MSETPAIISNARVARWRGDPAALAAHGRDDTFQHLEAGDYALVYGPNPKVGSGAAFPGPHTVAPHSHDRDQVLYSGSGMMTAHTGAGSWLLPPGHALWIPNGTVHSVDMIGPVLTRTLFTEPDLRVRPSRKCEVLSVSPLLHALLMTAYERQDAADDLHKRTLMSMLMMEVRRAPAEPLSLAMPTTRALATKCRRYLSDPTPHETIDTWCAELGMSRRTFTRLFRRETGQSFAAWRQKVCLFAAMPRLSAGETVADVAFSLGYSSGAAFASMFRKVLGATPRLYFESGAPRSISLDAISPPAKS